jgi:tRNA1Val (adenine37-N6)-methyltransferase
MPSSTFNFKQFSISQDKTAMKVGTDGVLLGAWANVEPAKLILDIGTGTGLIALMAAQRSADSKIYAVEIDPQAAAQAKENVMQSPFASRIEVIESDFFEWETDLKFDRILCNPPFYTNQHQAGNELRTTARHASTDEILRLLQKSAELLSNHGTVSLIVPLEILDLIKSEFNSLFISRVCLVQPTPLKPAHRALIELTTTPVDFKVENLVIEDNGRHRYSESYVKLTKEFYLNF